jgi:predicted acyl esterase
MHNRVVVVLTAIGLLLSSLALAVSPLPTGPAGAGELLDVAVAPGVEQVTITDAEALHPYTIVDTATDEALLTLISDEFSQLTFSYVPDAYLEFDPNTGGIMPTTDGGTLLPGSYRIFEGRPGEEGLSTAPFDVLAVEDVPEASFYESQDFDAGFHYLTTRDGVQLSIMVRFPDPVIAAAWGLPPGGPYPTVVEYSGYSPSNPAGTGEPGSMIANLMGFATVGVNIRGTGCSGGVFDVFNAAQRADGYDAIEVIASQDWVQGNRVGMVGLSYSGILQLYAASTAPPSLAAITPLSVIEDPWDQQWPGGIYNSGFTQEWLAERDRQSGSGSGWVQDRIAGGDTVCEANQQIRSQNIDFEEFAKSLTERPLDADARNLTTLVQNIDVPVYLSGGWQDEQTGSQFGDLLDDFDNAPVTKFRVYNGRHPDGYTPANLSRWYEHLSFYVKEQVPAIPPAIRAGAEAFLEPIFGAPGLGFDPDRFTGLADYAAAEQAYRDAPDVDLMWDFGAGHPTVSGAPIPRGSSTFASWPPPSTEWRQYLAPGGSLTDTAPAVEDVQRYAFDADGTGVAYADGSGSDFIKPQINANWEPLVEGDGLSFESPPLAAETVIAGDGYVDLWFRSEGTDAGIEVLLTEVYPTGEEVLVQHGLARAAYPDLDPSDSAGLKRCHLFYADNQQPLDPGELRNIQVPIYPVAHPFREGSRLRLTINTPGRDQPIWAYVLDDYDATFQEVAFGGDTPSSVVLPLVSGVEDDIVDTPPPCDSLRGQPCRDYESVVNQPGCASNRFTDLAFDNPFCVDVSALAAEGILTGDAGGTVRPVAPVSRQAMAAFLYRSAGSPDGDDPTCTAAPFPDVPATSQFCGEIAWANANGITTGFTDGTFRPTDPVSRQATAAFLHRLAALT